MTDQLASIVMLLEQRKTAIDKALAALREIGGTTASTTPSFSAATAEPTGRKYKISEEARERMRLGQQKRYAYLRKDPAPASTATAEPSGRKGKKRSAAVRRKMAEAQRKRYADLRAASEAAPAPEAPKTKRKISPEGIKRIIAATKKRWSAKRAEAKAAVKKAPAKKAGRKKVSHEVVPF